MTKKKLEDWANTQHFLITVDPFGIDVGFAINSTPEKTRRWLKQKGSENYKTFTEEHRLDEFVKDGADGEMLKFGGAYLILLRSTPEGFRYFLGTAVHEITHVIQYILRRVRTPLCDETEEMYAYHIGNLTNKFLMKLYK